MTLKIYTIQVSGIKCTNCAGKIKKALGERVPEITKVTVNVIQEKVYITLDNDLLLLKIIECLKDIGFPPLGDAVLVAGGQDAERSVHFIFDLPSEEVIGIIMAKVTGLPGVNKCTKADSSPETKISVGYNCEIIKGREIVDEVTAICPDFTIWNERVDGAKNQPKIINNKC
jgi:copper chaperone CopZ